MVVVRRRLIFWLIKAYIKKSKKILVLSFLCGLLVFFVFLFGARYLKTLFTFNRLPVVGIAGTYEKDNLPPVIVNKLSRGLTKIEKNGALKPEIATDYKIIDGGKTYVFSLRKDLKFSDGSEFRSHDLTYNFSDVEIQKPNKNTIVFRLKEPYAPFLATAARPVFKQGLIGVGDYFVKDIKLNGDFVQSITLGLNRNRFETIKYVIYPTESALKTAFALGEVTEVRGLGSTNFENTSFEKFPSTTINKNIDYSKLVTLFYNTTDKSLSDKKLRLALNYALPNEIKYGKKSYLPYSPNSAFYNKEVPERIQDFEHAKLLHPDSNTKLKITTLRKYKDTAQIVADSWSKIGIRTEIEEVDQIPDRFQIFLGDFNLPQDSDQYVLWHSGQLNNITRFKNLRIDLLLESGRKTTNFEERKKIYLDFQKFLNEEMPASFLYFPYDYTVTRN